VLPVRPAAGAVSRVVLGDRSLVAHGSVLQLRPLIAHEDWDVRVASSKCLATVARSMRRGAVADTFAAASCQLHRLVVVAYLIPTLTRVFSVQLAAATARTLRWISRRWTCARS
jgi:hypothetical protein